MAAFFDLPRKEVVLGKGRIQYRRVGNGPVLLFVHGLFVSGDLWGDVVDRLSRQFDCIVPELPYGSHRIPMKPGTDLTPYGLAQIINEFIGQIGIESPVIVGNDTGGAVCQVFVTEYPGSARGLILTPCDAFEQFPPKEFSFLTWAPRVPGLMWLLTKANKDPAKLWKTLHNGKLLKYPVSRKVLERFVGLAATDRAIRRDARKACLGCSPLVTISVAKRLPSYDRPVLVLWADGGAFFLSNGEKLARTFPKGTFELVSDSWSFSPLDQPGAVADGIMRFVNSRLTVEAA